MNAAKLLPHLCVAASIFGSVSFAQECPVATPTAAHKVLSADAGTWDATIRSYPNGPDSAPMVSRGTEVVTVIPGGLWTCSTFRADFGGMAYEGHGQFGYDPARKCYVGTWIDSMNPTLSVLEGRYDGETRTLTYTGEGVCPRDGSKLKQKMTTTTRADGTRVFALYVAGKPTGGQEVKMMETTYTRRK